MESAFIVGAGQFGFHIAKTMSDLRCEVMVIDHNEEKINEILPYVTNAQIGDSTNEDYMRSLGVSNYDVCIVTIGDNFQNSLETTALLKELGAKIVISRASNDVQEKFLLRNGADEVVYPEKQAAIRLATKFSSKTILDFIQLDSNYSIYEMATLKEWQGKTLAQLDLRKKYNVNIVSVKKNGVVMIPMPDTIFEETDVIYVIGNTKDIKRCFRI